MTRNADDAVLSRIIKLLALAEGRGSEEESMRAMEQVHRMLAHHNLSLENVRGHARSSLFRSRGIDETQFDALSDRWTIAVWHASADLFFCSYFYREEGAHDRRGHWRCSRFRHCLIASEANKITTKVMADHFCRVIRKLAQHHARQSGGGLATRRSFELGCADRLVERIRLQKAATAQAPSSGTTLPALLGLYDRERAANEAALSALGIKLQAGRTPVPKKSADVLAEHYGRIAAENISLALQIGAESGSNNSTKRAAASLSQIDFGF